MKFYNLIIMFIMLLGSSFVAAAIPTVTQVESTIASGNYLEARKQLGQVLKAYPDSYVANRYMFEVIKIENGRDNKPSVEYKLYEDKLTQITIATKKRIAIENEVRQKAIADKRFKTFINFLIASVLISFLIFISYIGYTRYQASQKIKKEKEEFEEWLEEVNGYLLNVDKAIKRSFLTTMSSKDKDLLECLDLDNLDVMKQVKQVDVNTNAVDSHIRNAREFLYETFDEEI